MSKTNVLYHFLRYGSATEWPKISQRTITKQQAYAIVLIFILFLLYNKMYFGSKYFISNSALKFDHGSDIFGFWKNIQNMKTLHMQLSLKNCKNFGHDYIIFDF